MCDIVRKGRFEHGADSIIYNDRVDGKQIDVCNRCWEDACNGVFDVKVVPVKRRNLSAS